MPWNMSFFITQEQIRNKTKTVTRRLGWNFLRPGDIVNACEKCQGLGKGGKIIKICQIKIINTWKEELCEITQTDVIKEGFPFMTITEFVEMFIKEIKPKHGHRTKVNRIEFEYI